ncbi:GPW/gp25 family protein [Desulfosporosinus sp. FKA]|uniref:GPW/gp25 family protein n=1 Tax=Desulfosporosinus sp. FKA TaxID=1969834 RepID=UPI000B4A13DB|nr:GPW/gp25 family protein [Desulfosporosinus sp. FKA]
MGDIYGTDIFQTVNQDWQVTGTSDIATISGLENLNQALKRRANTRVGVLFYAPSYGNPIYDMLSGPYNQDWVNRATAGARNCLLGDPRIKDVQVTVNPNANTRTVSIFYSWTDTNGNTGQFPQEVSTLV